MIFQKINAPEILSSYEEEISNITKLIKLIDKEIFNYNNNSPAGGWDPDNEKLFLFNKNDKIRLKKELEAKHLFHSAYYRRYSESSKRKTQQIKEIKLKLPKLLIMAKKAASNYKLKTDVRNKFKEILKRRNKDFTEEEFINYYAVLKQELILIKKIHK